MKQASAILWAQWRTMRNFYPRAGVAWTAAIAFLWYGFWAAAAIAGAKLISNPANLNVVQVAMPGALLIVFLYWQIVPLLMAATGSSLDLRKLQVYPIPISQMFSIEVMLRVTSGIEMLLILLGIAAGLALNPRLPVYAPLAVVPYVLFNLFMAVGLRDLLMRAMARKRIREIVVFLLVMSMTLPQLFFTRSAMTGRMPTGPTRLLFSGDTWTGWPWSAAANLSQGIDPLNAMLVLFLWTALAAVFGRWQFARTLAFDMEAAASRDTRIRQRQSFAESFFRLPSLVLSDPMAALVEKEIRMLARSPRFRLVFLMGFTFGMVMLFPMSMGRGGSSFLGGNYLTAVSVYSLLLLSESCFWNSFGFDRSAAQIYFLAPVSFSRVLIGKNLSAIFFISIEILAVTIMCGLMRAAVTPQKILEAYTVAAVVTIFLLAAGNLLSVRQARGANPANQFRAKAAGRVQAMLVIIYPIAFIPVALAYLARWVFETHGQVAFFGVLAFDAIAGLVVYRIALDSAVESAGRMREQMIAALSAADGPIAS
jgi:ABC-2 type transport system permease protein